MESGPPSSKQTVYLVDDDKEMRDYLAQLLEAAALRVQTFASAENFLNNYKPHQPGCLVSDIIMPEMSGLELQDILTERDIQLPVVFVSGHGDVTMTRTALKKGAVDFLEKPVSPTELIRSVRAALARDRGLRARRQELDVVQARLALLTPREREILDRLIAGHSNKQLAKDLGISVRTVETHRNRVLKKMRVNTFPALMRTLLTTCG